MSYYDRLIKDLHLLEAQAENLSSILGIKFESLKFHVWYILPFWNSQSQDFLIREKRVYKEWLQLDFGALEEVFDIELRDLLKYGNDDARRFYLGEDMMSDYRTFQLIERLRDHCLRFVETTWIKDKIMDILTAFEEGMKLLKIGFCNIKIEWMSRGTEGSTSKHRLDLINAVIGLLPHKLAYIIRLCTQFGDKRVLMDNLDYLDKMLKSGQRHAELLYLETLRPLGGIRIKTCCIEFTTICNFIDDLLNILKTLLADLPCPEIAGKGAIGSILQELAFIRSVVKRASTKLWEDKYWIVDAISIHIDVWATDSKWAFGRELAESRSRRLGGRTYRMAESWLCRDDGGETEKLNDAKQKILGIRGHMRKTLYVTDTSFSCVDEFLSFFKWLVEDVVQNYPSAENKVMEYELLKTTNQERDLQLLHTILQDAEDWLLLNQELKSSCQLIKQIFREGLWDLRRKWFRGLECIPYTSKPRRPVSIEFIGNVATQMPKANTLLLDLIKSLRGSKGNLKLSDSTGIVPTLADIFVREVSILRCIHVNLQTQYWDEEQSDDLFKDVFGEVTAAMHLYTTRFKDLDEEILSNPDETLKFFQASVRRAYLKFMKLSPNNILLFKSELVFHDTLKNLKDFKEHRAAENNTSQLGVLYEVFVLYSFFREQTTSKNEKPEEVMHLRTQIMKMGLRVENLIDGFEMVDNWFFGMWLNNVTDEAMLIKEEILKVSCVGTLKMDARASDATVCEHKIIFKEKASIGDMMIGFDEPENQLRTKLTAGTQQREIISIVGMPGLGKTTLAWNVYRNCAKYFHAQAWCSVSRDFQRKELLQNIITQIKKTTEDKAQSRSQISEKEEDLANELKQLLSRKTNYLIVLDDIWDITAWNALKQSFPMGNSRSRILITSRDKKVAMELNCDKSNCLELGFLNAKSSWHLLENKVFGAQSSPQNLRGLGQGIANRCGGLPLLIVVIAGVLKNTEKTEEKWKEVAESLESQLVMNQVGVFSKLEVSYNHLPIHMKQCFLYSGVFLKSNDIPMSKLVQLWCAERFVEDSDGNQSQESIAEKYLSDLVDRSLLIVVKRGFDNRIRTCRIHDLLREFAIQKATKDNFLVTANRCSYLTSLRRRLCFVLSEVELADPKHSFASKSPTRSMHITAIPTNLRFNEDITPFFVPFKSLFVLDIDIILGWKASDNIYKCVSEMKLLRYFSICDSIETIPSFFGDLLNLEVFIVRKPSYQKLCIPDDIFNLTKLRHLLINNLQITASKESNNSFCTSLQRFSTLNLSGLTARQIIARMPNLIKLRCNFEDDSIDFSVLNCLQSLESLRLLYRGPIPYPHELSFPSGVKKLTLSCFRLPWSLVETIAAVLPQLAVLKLTFNAFQGATWNTIGTFENLKLFVLKELDVEKWEASEDNFPSLERLIVQGCRGLESIPKAFGRIVYLNGIEVYSCNPSVVKSALKIKKKQTDDGNMLFDIIIYPPSDKSSSNDDDDDDESSD